MFPCKIIKFFNTKGFKIVELILVNTISYRFNGACVQSHEKNVKHRCNYMKMLTQGKETKEEEKSYIVHKIRDQVSIL